MSASVPEFWALGRKGVAAPAAPDRFLERVWLALFALVVLATLLLFGYAVVRETPLAVAAYLCSPMSILAVGFAYQSWRVRGQRLQAEALVAERHAYLDSFASDG